MKALLLLALLCASACAQGARENDTEPAYAMSLNARENWVEGVEIVMGKSMPPVFAASVSVQMPTPGWKLEVDEVGKPDAHGRIQVKVTGTGPEGIVAQVLSSETINVSLGRVQPGDYLLELWYRNSGQTEYKRRGVALLSAD